MIELVDVSKKYVIKKRTLFNKKEQEKLAVDKINIKIEKGKIIGLLGINGAGKSTTIKIISSLISPTSGEIYLNNTCVTKNPKKLKDITNVILGGEKNLYWRLTARENLRYFGSLYNIKSKELDKRIDELLHFVELENYNNLNVEKYSKGMKQRLQIARGLINDPEFILLDEPTIGLDITFAKEVRSYIKKLVKKENKGVLLTSHYISEVEELCDYIYILSNGKIVFEGTSEEIKKIGNTKKEIEIACEDIDKVINLIDKKVDIKKIGSNRIIISNVDNYQEIIDYLFQNKCRIIEFKILEQSLEDSLLLIFGGEYNALL